MPKRLEPGAFVARSGFVGRRITGVATAAAFVGPTSRGPITAPGAPPPAPLTSFAEFERLHGKARTLRFGGVEAIDHTALAVRAFFANGGARLHVARVAGEGAAAASSGDALDGPGSGVALVARDPGGGAVGGRAGVAFSVGLREEARVLAKREALRMPGAMVLHAGSLHLPGAAPDASAGGDPSALDALDDAAPVSLLTLAIEIADESGVAFAASDLGHDPRHPRFVGHVLGARPPVGAAAPDSPVELRIADGVGPFALRRALVGEDGAGRADVALEGGSDGAAPPPASAYRDALEALGALEEVTVAAAPASAATSEGDAVRRILAEHAETAGRRFAVLDPPPRAGARRVRRLAEGLEARSAALYHPWIEVRDPSSTGTLETPPSGAVCGLYARVDATRGVWKPPAGETLNGVDGVARRLGRRKRAVLAQAGVNPIRALRRRGVTVWGARTLSSDPEWRYVSVRRHFLHLRASIDRGLDWVVFEPNDEPLWDRIRTDVSDFLSAEWRAGGLAGFTPDQAFFVRCGRETTTQADLSAGRVVCEVGFAPLKPAEFRVFRIARRTADATG